MPEPLHSWADFGIGNTQASVDRLAAIARQYHLERILAVSHYWHLPRIKLAAGRREYLLYTVPCHESRKLAREPLFLAREVVAFWKYYAMMILG